MKGKNMKTPVIMVDFKAVSGQLWDLLYAIDKELGLGIIVVGEGLHHKENVHKLKMDRKNLILQLIHPLDYTNTFKLRQSFIKYFSETCDYDFEHVACVTQKKEDLKNNIVVNKNVCERIMKFYNIKQVKEKCYKCDGSGTQESYDQCGCVESEYSCHNCNGTGSLFHLDYKE